MVARTSARRPPKLSTKKSANLIAAIMAAQNKRATLFRIARVRPPLTLVFGR
jgi:hypothetical protein